MADTIFDLPAALALTGQDLLEIDQVDGAGRRSGSVGLTTLRSWLQFKNNLTAATDPGANDDEAAGYEAGSKWLNTSSNEWFICSVAEAGAAVWEPLSLSTDDLGGAAIKDVGQADSDLPTNSDIVSRFEIYSPDPERRAVEAATGGLCTIERTPNGQSCYMHVISKARCEDLAPGGELGTGVHEAFLSNGVERSAVLVGMYPAAISSGEVVSQPGLAPLVSQDFDTQRAGAAALGSGWHLFSIWEWAFVALWCMANGYQPTGNTNHGRSHANTWETAARQDGGVPGDSGGVGNTLTGYGPNAWNHNNGANGIADLVGNVWERLDLMKMVAGRIYLAADNEPGLAEAGWSDTGWDMGGNSTWSSSDNTGAPDSVKRSLIVPNGALDPAGNLYTTLTGERIPLRGGSRDYAGAAGLAALYLNAPRGSASSNIGFRLARLVS